MIDTLFFALQIIGIAILLGWAVVHDRLKEGAATRGPLAFKQHNSDTAEGDQDRKKPRGLTRHRGQATLKNWRH